MQKLVFVLGALLLVGGCKDKFEKAVSEMEGFKDKLCACKDKACADGVKKEMDEWEKGMAEKFSKDEKPPEKMMEKVDKIESEMRTCAKKFEKAEGDPPPAPAATP